MKKNLLKFLLVLLVFILVIWVSYHITSSEQAQEVVSRFGYFGIIIVALISGLDIVIPIPATTFIPIFLASGLIPLGITLALVIGTTIADFISFYIGKLGRKHINLEKYKLFKKLESLSKRNMLIPLVILFLWASVVPLPNEFLLIPLGLLGFRLRSLIVPFIAGNIIHHSILVFGISNILPFL